MTYYCLPVPNLKQFSCWNLCGFDQRSSATEVFDFDESGGNCPERERCLGCILTKDAGRSTLDITDIIYTPLQGRSLPTNRFSVTRMFVSQFGFISWTGSLYLLPFLLLAIEQSGWPTCTNWTLFSLNAGVWSSGRQISWNGTRLGKPATWVDPRRTCGNNMVTAAFWCNSFESCDNKSATMVCCCWPCRKMCSPESHPNLTLCKGEGRELVATNPSKICRDGPHVNATWILVQHNISYPALLFTQRQPHVMLNRLFPDPRTHLVHFGSVAPAAHASLPNVKTLGRTSNPMNTSGAWCQAKQEPFESHLFSLRKLWP